MGEHSYAPRGRRLVVMNDHEIQAASRCYQCGGHHLSRLTNHPKRGVWSGAALAVGLVTIGIAILGAF